jgi:carboxymethylenebutenolidase
MTDIDVPTADGFMPAYLARGAQGAPDRAPIVLVHEGFGLSLHTRTVADRLAARGHDVIAPHFYYRRTREAAAYDDIPLAVELTGSVTATQVLADFESAASIVARGDGPVLTMGFCFGGAVAYIAAAWSDRVDRAVAFYPVSIQKYWDEVGPPKRPLLVFYGDRDQFILPDERDWVKSLQGELDITVHEFPEAPHGYFNDVGPDRYDAEASEASWDLLIDFMDEAPTDRERTA